MHPDDLEKIVGRALRDLPAPGAPRTLLPRVVAAAANLAPRPWYTRAWFTWPRQWQVASLVAFAALAFVAVTLSPQAERAIDAIAGASTSAGGWLATAFDLASLAANTVNAIWRSVLLPLGLIAFAIILAMSLAGGVCLNIINRVSLSAEGASHS